jgi:glycosyltransferase involved in cell wall biosynthesis
MNYLIVNDIWSVKGGAERRLIDYDEFLKKDGHSVFVQTSERCDDVDYSTIDIAEFHNITYYGFDIFKLFITRYPEKTILYPHDFYPVCGMRVLGRRFLGKFRRCETPGIIRCSLCVGVKTYLQTMVQLRVFKKAQTIKLVSQFMVDKYKRLGFKPAGFIVDIQKVNREYRVLTDVKREENLIGFSGRDVEYKGFRILEEAIQILRENNVDFKFEHTGDKNWLSLEDMIVFYNRTKVVVVPSIWEEPSPLVAREAKACGALVVGSDIGGMRETNPDFIFRPGDACGLAEILQRIVEKH